VIMPILLYIRLIFIYYHNKYRQFVVKLEQTRNSVTKIFIIDYEYHRQYWNGIKCWNTAGKLVPAYLSRPVLAMCRLVLGVNVTLWNIHTQLKALLVFAVITISYHMPLPATSNEQFHLSTERTYSAMESKVSVICKPKNIYCM